MIINIFNIRIIYQIILFNKLINIKKIMIKYLISKNKKNLILNKKLFILNKFKINNKLILNDIIFKTFIII